nr:PREDICTED: zona pellucida sperm-binding protein 3-like [Lepisosteus oculatus]
MGSLFKALYVWGVLLLMGGYCYSWRISNKEIPKPSTRARVRPYQSGHSYRKGQAMVSLSLQGEGRASAAGKTVTVQCHEATVDITVSADLYGIGTPVRAEELRLGPLSAGGSCGAAAAGSGGSFLIRANLSDCGTALSFVGEMLIYTNQLFYTPAPSPGGIIRMNGAAIPIECRYARRYNVSSNALKPTWVPFTSTKSAEDVLDFTLTLMNDDWSSKRSSNVFYLGDVLNIEASVTQANHQPLRLFVDSCVATLVPDQTSTPSYFFIENYGCLTDARVTGSSSQFMPRSVDTKLQMKLDAFRFHRDPRSSIYITCRLKVAPVSQVDMKNKACSYTGGRWKSADGSDQVCGCCDSSCGSGFKSRASLRWKRGDLSSTTWLDWKSDATVGPLVVLDGMQDPLEEAFV